MINISITELNQKFQKYYKEARSYEEIEKVARLITEKWEMLDDELKQKSLNQYFCSDLILRMHKYVKLDKNRLILSEKIIFMYTNNTKEEEMMTSYLNINKVKRKHHF